MNTANHLRRGVLVCGLIAATLVGCGGSGIEGAHWRDSETVVLPPGSIQFDRLGPLRDQVAREHGCPGEQIVIGDPIEAGALEVYPLSTCGQRLYYAATDDGYLDVTDRVRAGRATQRPAPPTTSAPVEPTNPTESAGDGALTTAPQ
ncbi:MAG TPA: hypothetical protein ENK57_23100 [Polyangiaceae bacterium]|nr:hypothetical protein [Polyangiaceae bacterium]